MKKNKREFILGTMNFGKPDWGIDKMSAFNILDTFMELGYSKIDTSNFYSNGNSEIIIGEWMKSNESSSLKVCTKVGGEDPFDKRIRGLSYNNILKSIDNSLERLKVDNVYLVYLHYPDFTVEIDETLLAIKHLLDNGIIEEWGISNYPALEIYKLIEKVKELSIKPPLFLQILINLVEVNVMYEILPLAKDLGIKVLSWSPLCGGLLTTDAIKNNQPSKRFNYNTFWNFYQESPILSELQQYVSNNQSFVFEEIALSFLFDKNIVPIIGFENTLQLKNIHKNINHNKDYSKALEEISIIHDKHQNYPYNLLRFMGSKTYHR